MDNDKPSSKKPARKAAGKLAVKPRSFERPRGGAARAVADLVPEIGRAAFRRFGFIQSSIVTRWDEIVGSRYAPISEPESIRFPAGKKADGTLEMIVDPAFAPMIQHVLPEIIERVNRFFGYSAVARIKMRQGPINKPQKVSLAKAPPNLRPMPVGLGDSLREIGDAELHAVLESLAKSLAESPPKPINPRKQ